MKAHFKTLSLCLLLAGQPLFAGTLKELPHHLKEDAKESFWTPASLWGLTGGLALTIAVYGQDRKIQRFFDPEDRMGKARPVLNFMGDSLFLVGSTVAGWGISKLADLEEASTTFETMGEALMISQSLTLALKYGTQRRRPDGADRHSFPSAHASAAFSAAAVTEELYGPFWGIPSFALASAIAVARLDSNKHFASDTAFGALLGTLAGLGTGRFHRKEYPQFYMAPTISEGITGISLKGQL